MDPYLGELKIVPYNFAPQGWAFCNGQLLPIAQNTALFSLLGTQYGGNGVTTFALPDMRGRLIVGPGQGQGLSSYEQGQEGGTENVTLLASQIPSHNHPVQVSSAIGTQTAATGKHIAKAPLGLGNTYGTPPQNTTMPAGTIQPAGGGQPHNNRQPYLTLSYIIALQGVYPPR
jgi:microcystin-dependent protein